MIFDEASLTVFSAIFTGFITIVAVIIQIHSNKEIDTLSFLLQSRDAYTGSDEIDFQKMINDVVSNKLTFKRKRESFLKRIVNASIDQVIKTLSKVIIYLILLLFITPLLFMVYNYIIDYILYIFELFRLNGPFISIELILISLIIELSFNVAVLWILNKLYYLYVSRKK